MGKLEMREKIAHWVQKHTDFAGNLEWEDFYEDAQENFRAKADVILTLITEEIEKVENPYLYFGSPHTEHDVESNRYHSVFNQCRQAILSLLKE